MNMNFSNPINQIRLHIFTVKFREYQSGYRMSNKVDKLKKKLKYAFEENNYYEAHQIYRTIYYRCIADGLYKELLDLLFEGAIKLIDGWSSF